MLNVVTEDAGYPSGVLIRALEPVRNLPGSARGPGLLTRALGITRRQDGSDLRHGAVRVLTGSLRPEELIATSTRVGVEYAGRAAAAEPWRFFVAGNASVSPGRPTDPDRAARLVAARMRESQGIRD